MRVQTLLFSAALAAATATTVQAQVVLTVGSGLAHDCFVEAKIGTNPRHGVAVCNAAIERDVLSRKDRAGTFDNRGVVHDMLGDTDLAYADFHSAMELEPSLGDSYVNLGSMMIKKRAYQEALDLINKGLDLGMSYPHIGYYDRALAEEMLGRYKEAYYDYKKVLEIEPNFVHATDRLKDFIVTRAPAKT